MKIQYGVTVKIKRGGDNGSENGSDNMEETEDIMSSTTEYLQSWIGCLEQAIDELEKKYDSLGRAERLIMGMRCLALVENHTHMLCMAYLLFITWHLRMIPNGAKINSSIFSDCIDIFCRHLHI